MKILLDTNFILTCAKKKIDFVSRADEIFDSSIEWFVPEEVILELKKIGEGRGEKIVDRQAAKLGLKLLDNINRVELGTEVVDDGIVSFLKKQKEEFVLATFDRVLKKRVDVKILSIQGKSLKLV